MLIIFSEIKNLKTKTKPKPKNQKRRICIKTSFSFINKMYFLKYYPPFPFQTVVLSLSWLLSHFHMHMDFLIITTEVEVCLLTFSLNSPYTFSCSVYNNHCGKGVLHHWIRVPEFTTVPWFLCPFFFNCFLLTISLEQ